MYLFMVINIVEENKYKQIMLENGIKLPEDKADFTHVLELIEACEKQGLVVEVGTKSCDFEPLIKTKEGKLIAHIGIRQGCWYSLERSGREKGRFLRVDNQKTQDAEIQALIELANKSKDTKTVKKDKPKTTDKTTSNGIKTVDDFKEKVKGLDKTANAIHVKVLTDDIQKFCNEQDYNIEKNSTGYIIKVRM